MTSLRLLWIAPLLFGLSHCDHAVKPTAKLTPYAYHLALSLTPAAEAKMKTTGDNFVVFAYYYGLATPGFRAKADELNRIQLGEEQETYDGRARQAHMNAAGIDQKLLPETLDQQPYALVTVYTVAPAGYPDELLECRNFIGPIKLAQTEPQTISCDLTKA